MRGYNLAITLIILALSLIAKAQGDIRLGLPGYAGNGCPAGSVSATVSPDGQALSILFDQMVSEAGGTTGRTLDRKSCNISVPVSVPQGYSIAVFQVDYRGFTFVPYGGFARLSAEYFFAGGRGPVLYKNFSGPVNQDYLFTNNLYATSLVWTPCGAQTNLRVNASMIAQTNYQQEQTLATVDSADITAGLIYHIQWRRCF